MHMLLLMKRISTMLHAVLLLIAPSTTKLFRLMLIATSPTMFMRLMVLWKWHHLRLLWMICIETAIVTMTALSGDIILLIFISLPLLIRMKMVWGLIMMMMMRW